MSMTLGQCCSMLLMCERPGLLTVGRPILSVGFFRDHGDMNEAFAFLLLIQGSHGNHFAPIGKRLNET
jgi:hypothetical protein